MGWHRQQQEWLGEGGGLWERIWRSVFRCQGQLVLPGLPLLVGPGKPPLPQRWKLLRMNLWGGLWVGMKEDPEKRGRREGEKNEERELRHFQLTTPPGNFYHVLFNPNQPIGNFRNFQLNENAGNAWKLLYHLIFWMTSAPSTPFQFFYSFFYSFCISLLHRSSSIPSSILLFYSSLLFSFILSRILSSILTFFFAFFSFSFSILEGLPSPSITDRLSLESLGKPNSDQSDFQLLGFEPEDFWTWEGI